MWGRSFIWLAAIGALSAVFQQVIQKAADAAFAVEFKGSQIGSWLVDSSHGWVLIVGLTGVLLLVYVFDRLRRVAAANRIRYWLENEHRWSKIQLMEGREQFGQEKGTVQIACVDREYAAWTAEAYLFGCYGHVEYLVVDEYYSSVADKLIDAIIVKLRLPVSTMREALTSKILGIQAREMLRTARLQGLDRALAQLAEKPSGLVLYIDDPSKLKGERGLADIFERVLIRNHSVKPTIAMISNGGVPFPHIGRVMGLRGMSFKESFSIIRTIYGQADGQVPPARIDCNGQTVVFDRAGASIGRERFSWDKIDGAVSSARPFPFHAMAKASEFRATPMDYVLAILYWKYLLCDGYPSRMEHFVSEIWRCGTSSIGLNELPALISPDQCATASWPVGMFFYSPSFCIPRATLTGYYRPDTVEEMQNLLVEMGFFRVNAASSVFLELDEGFLVRNGSDFKMTARGREALQARLGAVRFPKAIIVEVETWAAKGKPPDIGEDAMLATPDGIILNWCLWQYPDSKCDYVNLSPRFHPSSAFRVNLEVKLGKSVPAPCVAGWSSDTDRILVEACGMAWPQNEAESGRRVWLPRPTSSDSEKICRNFELSINLALEWLTGWYDALNWRGKAEDVEDAVARGELIEFPEKIHHVVGSLAHSGCHREATVSYAKQEGGQSLGCAYFFGSLLGELAKRHLVKGVAYEHARFDWLLARLAGILAGDPNIDGVAGDPTSDSLFPHKRSIPDAMDNCPLFKYLLLRHLYFSPGVSLAINRSAVNWEDAAALELAEMTGENEFEAMLLDIAGKNEGGLKKTTKRHYTLLWRRLHSIRDRNLLHALEETASFLSAIPPAERDEEHPLRLAMGCWTALCKGDSVAARAALKKFKSAGDVNFLRHFEFKKRFIDDVEEELLKYPAIGNHTSPLHANRFKQWF